MNEVKPIKDKKKIEEFKSKLGYVKDGATTKQIQTAKRNRLLFIFGINTGLRISDIIKIKVKDVKDKEQIVLIEQKTNKKKIIGLNDELKRELNEFIVDKADDEYIFSSNKGGYLKRTQAYDILNKTAKELGIEEIGTHTLRKTFGYHFYKQTKDVAFLMKLFNHSSQSITLRYIGIDEEDIINAYNCFSL